MPEGNAFQPEEWKTAMSQNLFTEKHETFKVVILAQGKKSSQKCRHNIEGFTITT